MQPMQPMNIVPMMNVPMMMPQATQGPNPQLNVESAASVVMKQTTDIQVNRDESCLQCGWDYRFSTYNSAQGGSHKIQKFDPCCINACCCWPIKKCCCSYNMPPHVSNEFVQPDGVQVVFPNPFHGVVYVKGVAIGSFEYQQPGCFWQCLICQQPKIVIKKAVTNETLTLKANDNCLLGYLEFYFGCFLTNKAMFLEKQGSTTIEGRYTRSCFSAILNTLCCNPHFYDNLNLNFQQFITSDAEKVLVYSAFILLQENTKINCCSLRQACQQTCGCFMI
ncbi:hypothetical protein TTHERM_000822063 (macronuclear) [Tetrahymena thermophila SB210]|uniref:Phospholipid scramblase n=1 Tax=Tetrahymena thermophila (strain SB210) TaxID=312017 RepID=W7X8H8_TETTS|nr:hypothetical protein TTHERM_000822063 [Tetrahymena thermophila SB210]EWS72713.1 hypothetical protein TTHERM_000822063 [Tetrahymena thermophila SB210]|eukprot:XP_012654755.1 hypothetical protein TTHERM_000822063 [Tetrahymena thermophila SB210]